MRDLILLLGIGIGFGLLLFGAMPVAAVVLLFTGLLAGLTNREG